VSVDLLPLSVSATAHAAVLSAIVNFGVDEFETIGANGVEPVSVDLLTLSVSDTAHAAVLSAIVNDGVDEFETLLSLNMAAVSAMDVTTNKWK